MNPRKILQNILVAFLFFIVLTVGIFTVVIAWNFFTETEGYPGNWSAILYGSIITLVAIFSAYKLHNRWDLKWKWRRFIEES